MIALYVKVLIVSKKSHLNGLNEHAMTEELQFKPEFLVLCKMLAIDSTPSNSPYDVAADKPA